MSGITGAVGPSDYGMMGSLIANATSVRQKLDQLTNQASTGLVGNTYAGLGSGASVSLDLRPQIASMQTWQNNVDAATGRMSVAQTALTRIQSIASNFYAQLNNLEGVEFERDRQRCSGRARRAWAGRGGCWTPRTAASTSSPDRTPAIHRCRIPTAF